MSRRMLVASIQCGSTTHKEHLPINLTSLEWFFNRTSILFWAEKIYMTRTDFDHVERNDLFRADHERELARDIFDWLKNEGIVHIVEPEKFLPKVTTESIDMQVYWDEECYGNICQEEEMTKKKNHCTIKVGEYSYCPPIVRGIYSALTMSYFLSCSCLMNDMEISFCRDRFVGMQTNAQADSRMISTIHNLYQVFVPTISLQRDFELFCPEEHRLTCANSESCIQRADKNLERLKLEILNIRSKPEMVRLTKYIDSLDPEDCVSNSRVWRLIQSDVNSQQKALLSVLPAVKSWTAITEKALGFLALFAATNNDALLTISAGALSFVASLAGIGVDRLSQESLWLATLVSQASTDNIREFILKGDGM